MTTILARRAPDDRQRRRDERRQRMQNVIGSHLERFGKRDALSVAWS